MKYSPKDIRAKEKVTKGKRAQFEKTSHSEGEWVGDSWQKRHWFAI